MVLSLFRVAPHIALIERATDEKSLYDGGTVPDGLSDVVFGFHRSVCEIIGRTRDHASPGAPPAHGDAKGLAVVVAQFKTDLCEFPGFDLSCGIPLATCMPALCDDVERADVGTVETCTYEELTRQHTAVMQMLGTGPPPPKLPLMQRIREALFGRPKPIDPFAKYAPIEIA